MTSMKMTVPVAGSVPMLGKLIAPEVPWQATVAVAVLSMIFVLVPDLFAELNRHREIVRITELTAPDAPMNDVVQAIIAIRPATDRKTGGS